MNKNKKRMLFSFLAFLGAPLMLVGFLTNFWALNASGTVHDGLKYKIFDEIPKWFTNSFSLVSNNYQEIWRTLLLVSVLVALFAFMVYMVFTLLECLELRKVNTNLFKKISSYVLIASSVLILTFGLLFSLLNVIDIPLVSYSLKPEIGFYAMILGPAVAGILGLTGAKKDTATKTKKGKK